MLHIGYPVSSSGQLVIPEEFIKDEMDDSKVDLEIFVEDKDDTKDKDGFGLAPYLFGLAVGLITYVS